MKQCKSCKKEIDANATKCPFCQTDQRSWFRRHPILTVIFGLIFLGFIGSAAGGKKSSPTTEVSGTKETTAATSTPETKEKSYVLVTELSGNANKNSDTFKLTGGKVKLTYDFKSNTSIVGAIYILKEGTDIQKDGGIPEVMVSDAGNDSTIVRKAAGDYYLHVAAANASWTVKLEEER